MTALISAEAVWDDHAARLAGKPVRPPRRRARFTWTQYPCYGPDESVLGNPSTALDLGCGTGGNAAYLAAAGVGVVGVDISMVALNQADEKWGHLSRLGLAHQDAVAYLRANRERYSAIYSVFGAVWFTDPRVLLPLVRYRLKPGGVFAFSQEPPIEGCYGCQGQYVRTRRGHLGVLRRWAYTPAMWRDLLVRHGFTRISATVIPPPEDGDVSTLLVRAQARPGSGPSCSSLRLR